MLVVGVCIGTALSASTRHWAISVPGGRDVARRVADDLGGTLRGEAGAHLLLDQGLTLADWRKVGCLYDGDGVRGRL